MASLRTVAYLGVDIGTSSSKGVLVGVGGTVLATESIAHDVSVPQPGRVEMDATVWMRELRTLTDRLTTGRELDIRGLGVSGMGPCLVVCDEHDQPLRPAILYGIDVRSVEEARFLEHRLGRRSVLERCGSVLGSQALGPKLLWVRRHEPEVWSRAARFFTVAGFLVRTLTGRYVLDHHSASQSAPMYDLAAEQWLPEWCREVLGDSGPELPDLLYSGDVAGELTVDLPGVPRGVPVTVGTIDAWSEAVSVGAEHPGDLMLMYGSTMFLIATTSSSLRAEELWSTRGTEAGRYCLAGGLATSGSITQWWSDSFGVRFDTLVAEAEQVPPGSGGLLTLPHFAGERTPFADPDARGAIVGLTLEHRRGALYRSALEAVGFAVRHNLEHFAARGAELSRVSAVGGGAGGRLWTQIVSDVTGREQTVREVTVGASVGNARLVAAALGRPADIETWNPVERVVRPDDTWRSRYDEMYSAYLDFQRSALPTMHQMASIQK
ncbi:MAG: FGGY-family carbohydrate kinase, partial [Phycicoccus sp.]